MCDKCKNKKSHNITNIILIIILIILIELVVGTIGFYVYNNLNWVDSFRNAAMIIPAVGEPINAQTDCGKIYSSTYSLVTGFVTIVIIAILVGEIIAKETEETS